MRVYRKMNRIALMLVVILLLGMLAACGGANSNETKSNNKPVESTGTSAASTTADQELSGEVTLWTWVSEFPNMTEEFNKKYPNIKIKVVNVASEDMVTKLQTTIASGGELPDVVQIERTEKPLIYAMDILDNLEQPPYNADRSLIFDYDQVSFSKDGHLVSIPLDISVTGLAYIKDLTKQYFGTDDPEQLEALFPDWDTFIEKGKEVVAASGGEVKMLASLADAYIFVKGQRSGPFFDGDKLNSDVLEEVMTELVRLRDSGIVDVLDQWSPAWQASFAQDKYVFYPSAAWVPMYVIGPNDPSETPRWGLMAAPEGGLIWGGSSLGIPKDAKNKELAWKWIEFGFLSQEGAEAMKLDGVFTHYKPAYDDPEFTSLTWPNFGDQDIGEKFFKDINEQTTDISENEHDVVLDEVMNLILQTLAKDESFGVEEAVNKVKEELKAKVSDIIIE